MRALLVALAVCSIVVVGATLVGRAIDTEIRTHVMYTRDGVTLDCERSADATGRVFYDSCVRIP